MILDRKNEQLKKNLPHPDVNLVLRPDEQWNEMSFGDLLNYIF